MNGTVNLGSHGIWILGLHRVWYSTRVIEYQAFVNRPLEDTTITKLTTYMAKHRESSVGTLRTRARFEQLTQIPWYQLTFWCYLKKFFPLFYFSGLSASRLRQDRLNLFEPMDTCKISGSFEFLDHLSQIFWEVWKKHIVKCEELKLLNTLSLNVTIWRLKWANFPRWQVA